MLMSKIQMDWLLYIMVNKYLVSFSVRWINWIFFTASRWGHKNIVEILFSKGANVDGSNNVAL